MSIATHPESTHPSTDETRTPALVLFELVQAAGYAPTRQAFADLVKVDRGNIYNYLAPNGSPWRVAATTETIRQWGHSVERGTSSRAHVAVTEGVRGEVTVTVEGLDAEGTAFSTSLVRAALPLANHAWGSLSGRAACDALVAEIRAYQPGVVCEHGDRRCTLRAGRRDLLRIEHRQDAAEVRVLPKVSEAEREALRSALEAQTISKTVGDVDGSGSGRSRFVRVGTGHVEPAHLARELALALKWWTPGRPTEEPLPEELDGSHWEGGSVRVSVNRYERDPSARDACIAKRGTRCAACERSYGEDYGPLGEGYIHVHHLHPLHAADGPREVDPTRDLAPVCANCHCMLHRGTLKPRSIEELRAILARHRRPA